MYVLCFHPDKTPPHYTRYIDALVAAFPQTLVTGSHEQLTTEIMHHQPDIALLPCDDHSWQRIRRLAATIRAAQPTCLIMIYRPPFNPHALLTFGMPDSMFDLLLDCYLDTGQLPAFASTLSHRRRHQLLQLKEPRPLKGIVAIDHLMDKVLIQSLSRNGMQLLNIEISDHFETEFRRHLPDFLVVHCHNLKSDFDIVKRATHTARRLHPGCIIYVTCSGPVIEVYSSRYRFHEYLYDGLLSLPLTARELQLKLIKDLSRRYHLSFSQS